MVIAGEKLSGVDDGGGKASESPSSKPERWIGLKAESRPSSSRSGLSDTSLVQNRRSSVGWKQPASRSVGRENSCAEHVGPKTWMALVSMTYAFILVLLLSTV